MLMRCGTHNFNQIASYIDTTLFANFDLLIGVVGNISASVSATILPWRDGWNRCTLTSASTTANAFALFMVSSATSQRAEVNTLSTNIYIAGAQVEAGTLVSSYIPTGATPATRAADGLEEVATPYPSMSDVLDSGVATSHIGLPINGAETTVMSRLQVEASPGTLNWGAELIFTS